MAVHTAPTNSYTLTLYDQPGNPVGHDTAFTGINDAGVIVGYTATSIPGTNDPTVRTHGLYLSGGSWSFFNVPGQLDTYAYDIDNSGFNSIVGYSFQVAIFPLPIQVIGFMEIAGTGVFDAIGGILGVGNEELVSFQTVVNGTDDRATMVGVYANSGGATNGFVMSGQAAVSIQESDAVGTTTPDDINNNGQIVGYYGDDQGAEHGFILNLADSDTLTDDVAEGIFTPLDVPGAFNNQTFASGINDLGEVAGTYEAALNQWRVFVYRNGDYTLYNVPTSGGSRIGINDEGQIVGSFARSDGGVQGFVINDPSLACYCKGTRVMTPLGEIAVERLTIGDLVTTHDGELRPVKWIGRRRLDCRRHPRPEAVIPVRVLAHAFGPDLPRRDLCLSPDHAIYVEGALIPIRHLVNDVTILRDPAALVFYYHIELESHDVIFAEGLPAETWLDTDGRRNFDNGGLTALHPEFAGTAGLLWETLGFAPLLTTGPVLERVKRRLNQRKGVVDDQVTQGKAQQRDWPIAAASG